MKTSPFTYCGKVDIALRFVSWSEPSWILYYSVANVVTSEGEYCGLERDGATADSILDRVVETEYGVCVFDCLVNEYGVARSGAQVYPALYAKRFQRSLNIRRYRHPSYPKCGKGCT